MFSLSESTVNLLISAAMGIIGGLFTIPINALLTWSLKRDELLFKHKLDLIAKQRELLLQHKLELENQRKDSEIASLTESVKRLEQRLADESN